jgi:hypothetical protein
MKKLSMLLVSISLLFLFSVSNETNGKGTGSLLAQAPTDNPADHPIQPPV